MAKNKQQNGFTLIEAVVTTAIVATMSALVLTGMYGARDKFQVRNAAQQFASDLRETILMTKNGVNVSQCRIDYPVSKRDCSAYKIFIPSGGEGYNRLVTGTDVATGATTDYADRQFTLPGGTNFSVGIGSTTSSSFAFPNVTVPKTTFTVASKNNGTIKMNVCLTSNGAVSVITSSCP